jgi:hypothetical protein
MQNGDDAKMKDIWRRSMWSIYVPSRPGNGLKLASGLVCDSLVVEEVVDGRYSRVEKGVIEDRGLSRARSIRELAVVIRWRDRPEEIGLREGVNGLVIFCLLVLEGEGLSELEILKFESSMGLDAGGSKSGGLDIGVRWE